MSNINTKEENDYNNKKDIQSQAQLNKQKIALKQDQNASNTIMCRILSELENLVLHLGYKYEKGRYFEYYATKQKNIEDIIYQIILQMTIFESSYKNFKKNNPNRQYEYPKNLSQKEIIEIVNNWKNFLKNKKNKKTKANDDSYESYYDEFLNILKNNNLSNSFKKEFDNLEENSEAISKDELKRVMNSGVIASSLTNEKNKEIEKEIMEKGDFSINVVIGGKRDDNPYFKNTEKYDHKFNELKSKLENYLDLSLGYLEFYALLNSDKNSNFHIKYINNIKDEFEKDVLSKYSTYLHKFYEKNNKIYNDYSYEIPKDKLDKIKSDIERWKKYIKEEKAKNELEDAIKCIYNNEEPLK